MLNNINTNHCGDQLWSKSMSPVFSGLGFSLDWEKVRWGDTEGRKEMFYLTTHSTHFIYGYMASDIWLSTILIVKKEIRSRHIGCSFRLAARVLLYAPSHRQDSTYHGLCYTSRGALAGREIYIQLPGDKNDARN